MRFWPELPPVANGPLSIILLAGPEDNDNLETVLPDWLGFLEKRGSGELLLVQMPNSVPVTVNGPSRLRVLQTDKPGEGVALRLGLSSATCPLVFYTLARPEYRSEDLQRMLTTAMPEPPEKASPLVVDHVHLMGGYRAGVKVPALLRGLGWIWRIFCLVVFSYSPTPLPGWLGWRRHFSWIAARLLFGLREHDVACPFRLLRRDILPRIPIQSTGSFCHVEVLAKANFLGTAGGVTGESIVLDVKPGPYRGDAQRFFKDAKKIFQKPDFGPAQLPTAEGMEPGKP